MFAPGVSQRGTSSAWVPPRRSTRRVRSSRSTRSFTRYHQVSRQHTLSNVSYNYLPHNCIESHSHISVIFILVWQQTVLLKLKKCNKLYNNKIKISGIWFPKPNCSEGSQKISLPHFLFLVFYWEKTLHARQFPCWYFLHKWNK